MTVQNGYKGWQASFKHKYVLSGYNPKKNDCDEYKKDELQVQ